MNTQSIKIREWIIEKAQQNCELCNILGCEKNCKCNEIYAQYFNEHPNINPDNPPAELFDKASEICNLRIKKLLDLTSRNIN